MLSVWFASRSIRVEGLGLIAARNFTPLQVVYPLVQLATSSESYIQAILMSFSSVCDTVRST